MTCKVNFSGTRNLSKELMARLEKVKRFFLRIISVLDNDLGPEGGNENIFKGSICILAVNVISIRDIYR